MGENVTVQIQIHQATAIWMHKFNACSLIALPLAVVLESVVNSEAMWSEFNSHTPSNIYPSFTSPRRRQGLPASDF